MDITDKLKQLKICVVLPTYNNAGTLALVVDDLLVCTAGLIVVNDGSTDGTAEILKRYAERITLVTYERNRGKGYALKQGFRKALELGYEYALTMDTDGQHRIGDLAGFVEEAERIPGGLIVGSRLLKQKNMPGEILSPTVFPIFGFGCRQVSISRIHSRDSGFIRYNACEKCIFTPTAMRASWKCWSGRHGKVFPCGQSRSKYIMPRRENG